VKVGDGKKKAGISRRGFLKAGALGAGAVLAPRVARGAGRPASGPAEGEIDREVASCCQFCQVRCTTLAQVRGDRVVNVYGNKGNAWTDGKMCPKGQALVELTYSPHRLLYPLLRDGSAWRRVTYGEALDAVAGQILKVKAAFPEDHAHRVVLFAPLWESHESEIAAQMALYMSGFPDICSPGDTCIGSSATALRICLGSPVSTTTVDEVLNAETLVLWGANIAEMYPPYVRWIDRAREKGVRVVYLDPRVTSTSNNCDEQIMGRPGTDGALALGLARVMIKEDLYDRAYVARHVDGFTELAAAAEGYTPEKVAGITWIPAERVTALARQLAASRRTVVWLGGSISRYTNSLQSVRAIVALQALTANLSGPGKGIMNVQGGKPGGVEPFEETFRPPGLEGALSFRKVLFAMEQKRVKVLLLNSSYRRYPDARRVRKAIGNVDFVVYRGFFMDDEAALAHLIIPGTMPFESAGSQYGAQRQLVWRNQVVPARGETVEDWRFYSDLGRKINGEKFPAVKDPEDILEMVRRKCPTWAGFTKERLQKAPAGICWPCPGEDHPGTRGTLYPGNRFMTTSGKVELRSQALGPIEWSDPEGAPQAEPEKSKDFPLIFLQGKVVQHWQHTYTNWSAYMSQFSNGNYVQVHPDTVKGKGLKDGDWANLETEVGKIRVRVVVSETILPGLVWTPSHPANTSPYDGNKGESINTIVPSSWDKVSAQFNGFGCRLTKA